MDKKHGGKREGAGRPLTIKGQKREVYLSDDDWEYLLRIGKGNASKGVRVLKAEYIERTNEIEREHGLTEDDR